MRLKIMLAALPLLLVACSSGEAPTADGSPAVTASSEVSESTGEGSAEKEGEGSAAEAASEAPADGSAPSSEASEDAGAGEDGENNEPSRLEGVPEDFPAALPLPTGIARVSSSTSSGSGSEKTWALSFGLAGSEWKAPCVDYSGALSAKGYRSALRERSSQYVSETLVGQDVAVSMACEEGRMVILVGPAL